MKCVDLCVDIIREEIKEPAPHHERKNCQRHMKSVRIFDDYTIGQELTKKFCCLYKSIINVCVMGDTVLTGKQYFTIGPTAAVKRYYRDISTPPWCSFYYGRCHNDRRVMWVKMLKRSFKKRLQRWLRCAKAQRYCLYWWNDKITCKSENPSITRDVSDVACYYWNYWRYCGFCSSSRWRKHPQQEFSRQILLRSSLSVGICRAR